MYAGVHCDKHVWTRLVGLTVFAVEFIAGIKKARLGDGEDDNFFFFFFIYSLYHISDSTLILQLFVLLT